MFYFYLYLFFAALSWLMISSSIFLGELSVNTQPHTGWYFGTWLVKVVVTWGHIITSSCSTFSLHNRWCFFLLQGGIRSSGVHRSQGSHHQNLTEELIIPSYHRTDIFLPFSHTTASDPPRTFCNNHMISGCFEGTINSVSQHEHLFPWDISIFSYQSCVSSSWYYCDSADFHASTFL